MGAPWEEGKRLFALQTRFMAARGELNAPSAPQYIALPWKMDRLVETKQNHFHQLYHKAYLCRWYRAWQTLDPQKYGSMEFISIHMKGRV